MHHARERLVDPVERAQRRPDPSEQHERRSLRLALEVRDEEAAGALLAAVRLDRRVGNLGPVAVRIEHDLLVRAHEVAGQRHGHLAVEEDRRVIGEPELEHVGFESRLQGLLLLFRQADELVVRADRDGEGVELAVDLLEGELADEGSRAEGESRQEEGGDERPGQRNAGASPVERQPAHRSR